MVNKNEIEIKELGSDGGGIVTDPNPDYNPLEMTDMSTISIDTAHKNEQYEETTEKEQNSTIDGEK